MTPDQIDAALDAAESAVAGPKPVVLSGTGYWPAVAEVKRDRSLVDVYADRIGAIDQAAFRSWAPIVVQLWLGTTLAVLGSAAGLVMIGVAYGVDDPWNGIWFLAGTAALLVGTHGLGHLVAGAVFGIRFTVWFSGFRQPQPGVKTDYASYLRAPAKWRAWMHAAGAIVTKAIPFLLIPSALIADVPWWATTLLVAFGVFQLLTDALWSTKVSDWSRFKREMRISRAVEQ